MPKSDRDSNWIWGKLLGFQEGDKVRLVSNHRLFDKEAEAYPPYPWEGPLEKMLRAKILKKGTVGNIVKVIPLSGTVLYIVDFPFEGGRIEEWVTEYEIEPAE